MTASLDADLRERTARLTVAFDGTAWVLGRPDLGVFVAVPRNRRHGVYLAGMVIETVVVAAVLGLRMLTPPGGLDALLAAVILFRIVAIVWQWAALPLRSDSYALLANALLANALRCHNLYRITWLTVKNRIFRLTGPERLNWPVRARGTVRWPAGSRSSTWRTSPSWPGCSSPSCCR